MQDEDGGEKYQRLRVPTTAMFLPCIWLASTIIIRPSVLLVLLSTSMCVLCHQKVAKKMPCSRCPQLSFKCVHSFLSSLLPSSSLSPFLTILPLSLSPSLPLSPLYPVDRTCEFTFNQHSTEIRRPSHKATHTTQNVTKIIESILDGYDIRLRPGFGGRSL